MSRTRKTVDCNVREVVDEAMSFFMDAINEAGLFWFIFTGQSLVCLGMRQIESIVY